MPLRWPAPEPGRDPRRESQSASSGPGASVENKERWRLAWRYGQMTDGELEALAADSSSLTEVARRALQAELNRRSLPFQSQAPAEPVSKNPPQSRQLVTVRRFRDMPEALLATSVLESAGMFCSLDDANIVRTDWLWSNMVGGIKLRVQQEDFEAASNLLDQNPPSLQPETSSEFADPACPSCHSVDISLDEWHEPAANASDLLVSSLNSDATWLCLSCGHRWQDADQAE